MINIAHFITITPKQTGAVPRRFQNFFYASSSSPLIALPGTSSPLYAFAPFRVEGATAQLNGENETVQVLFPFTTFGVRLVEEGDGNRLSRMELRTVWLENNKTTNEPSDYLVSAQYTDSYIGVGASFSDTTIELRFKSAMDSVNANIPALSFTKQNTGILPLNSDINLR
jgi:hypothetical protein